MIEYADVVIRGRQVVSQKFSDIYGSSDGPDETRRTFLEPARIRQRMAATSCFTIFELGFGTGLNFAISVAEFLKYAPTGSRLRYFSVEKHPLRPADFRATAKLWTESASTLSELADSYPPPVPGWHRRSLHDGRVQLTVFYGDVSDGLATFLDSDRRGVDAWFLDGFAPAKNPEMFEPALLEQLHRGTSVSGTVTTYTAAGTVRRALQNGGFDVARIDARPLKRHTTLATLSRGSFVPHTPPASVVVAGGGIAGTATARALADKGVSVHVCDPNGVDGSCASAIPAAITHGRLSAEPSAQSDYRLHSSTFAQSCLGTTPAILSRGVLMLPDAHYSWERLQRVEKIVGDDWLRLLDTPAVSELLDCDIASCGAWFPRSLVVAGQLLREHFVDHRNISVEMQPVDVHAERSSAVVIATGNVPESSDSLPPFETANLEGQVDLFSTESLVRPLNVSVVRDGYVACGGSSVVSGSTYEYRRWPPGRATNVNRTRLEKLVGPLTDGHGHAFRASRTVTSDRFPIVGRVGDNTWVNLAHGSSGTISGTFAAECIASEICGELVPGTGSTYQVTSPFRFAERQRRRPNPFLQSRTQASR